MPRHVRFDVRTLERLTNKYTDNKLRKVFKAHDVNKPHGFILALVSVSNGYAAEPRYIRQPFRREPDFGVASVTYRLADLLARASVPT